MRGALAGSGLARAWLLAASAALPLACGEAEEKPVAAAPPVAPEPLSGLYEVSGTTVARVNFSLERAAAILMQPGQPAVAQLYGADWLERLYWKRTGTLPEIR